MERFELSPAPIDPVARRRALEAGAAGAVLCFEGVVRERNAGRAVLRLGYQAYATMAEAEGTRVLAEVRRRHEIVRIAGVHRVGVLEIGEVAVWIGVSAAHRDAAFAACREAIDEIKRRVPIWKQEHYADGASEWLHPGGG